MNESEIYLDYNASTPLAPEVVEAMRPFLTEHFGNPSSHHWAGAPAKAAVERARAQVAALLGCEPDEVIFTSGGSESNNHALKGVFFANRQRGEHFVTSAVEHPAVLEPLRFLETLGAKVTVVGWTARVASIRRTCAGAHAAHDPRERHAREQRGRDGAAHRGDREPRPRRPAL